MNIFLKSALWYASQGMSVIPCREKPGQKEGEDVKKPYVKWKGFQTRKATPEEITAWWEKWPDAMIGIVTGAISGVVVVDLDREGGSLDPALEALEPYFRTAGLHTPMATTPSGGQHWWFAYPGVAVVNKARILPGVDTRADGGYIVAPPSQNSKGRYEWIPGAKIGKVALSHIPSSLLKIINAFNNNSLDTPRARDVRDEQNGEVTTGHKKSQEVTISFQKGTRDNDLFHIANGLLKGGVTKENAARVLEILAKNCEPPFPENEIKIKIQSALERQDQREKTVTQIVREWVEVTSGHFRVTDCLMQSHLVTKAEKHAGIVALCRMRDEGLIERVTNQNGVYRRVENQIEMIDWKNASTAAFDIRWPFGIENHVTMQPKNVAVIAGEANAGKTAFLLNVIRMNQNRGYEIFYASSEMGAAELRTRLEGFDVPLSDWNFTAFERSGEFSDIIKSDAINIIDYLEISDAFYEIGGAIRGIYEKLRGGVAIIAIQKDKKSDVGRGGAFTLEKPRLYLTLADNAPDGATLTIRKGKLWAQQGKNPNGLKINFKIYGGARLENTGPWGK